MFAYLWNRRHSVASRLARFERLALSCAAPTVGGTLLLGTWSGLVTSEQGAWYLRSAELTGWALLFGWVVARCARGAGGALGRVLEWRALRYLGRISYGIYLYHLFVPYFWWRSLAVAGVDIGVLPPLMLAALFVASTVLLAALSRHYLELPVDRFKERFRRDPPIPGTHSESGCRPRSRHCNVLVRSVRRRQGARAGKAGSHPTAAGLDEGYSRSHLVETEIPAGPGSGHCVTAGCVDGVLAAICVGAIHPQVGLKRQRTAALPSHLRQFTASNP